MSTAKEQAAARRVAWASKPKPGEPDAIIVSVRLKSGTFESSIEVPTDATPEQFKEFAEQWMKMMLAGVRLGHDLN